MGFEAYHNATAAQHQANVDRLSAAGFHPETLNVSGDPGEVRYAAVWVDDPGPGWRAVHGLDAAGYQATFSELTSQGWAPVIVTATGPRDRATFAAVFEGDHREDRFAHHDLSWNEAAPGGSLQEAMGRARRDGFIPTSLGAYGSPGDERYLGVWTKNVDAVQWSMLRASLADYQRAFNAFVDGGMRPGCVAITPNDDVIAVLRDDQVGAWTARHGLSADEYQAEFNARATEGLRPYLVCASTSGRYAAAFATTDRPIGRQFSATGDDLPVSSDLDGPMFEAMRDQGIRSLSVAFSRAGTLVGRRAYTWAEPGYPITQPGTRFRIASVSKAFAAATISELVARGLAWNTPALPYVGVTSTLPLGTPAHTELDTITVQDLVLQAAVLPRDFDRDQRGIAAALSWPSAPLPRDLVLKYFYGGPLGKVESDRYSNPGFYLLTQVVEQRTGMSFLDAAQQFLLDPLGIKDVTVATTGPGARQPGEVATYDDPDIGPSQFDYSVGAVAPKAYGGEFVLENCAGAGGLVTSAGTMARLIGTYPVWNAPNMLTGRVGATRYGSLPGTSAGAVSRGDDLDFAFVFNRASTPAWKDAIRDRIHTYLNAHGTSLTSMNVREELEDSISSGVRGAVLGQVDPPRPVSDEIRGDGRFGGLFRNP